MREEVFFFFPGQVEVENYFRSIDLSALAGLKSLFFVSLSRSAFSLILARSHSVTTARFRYDNP